MQTYLNKLVSKFWLTYKNKERNTFLQAILGIASFVYFLLYKSRLLLYKLKIIKSHNLPAVVISVGNISCGGTGKTPLTIELAKYLINQGYKVAVLSRGYKRQITGTHIGALLISDGQEILTDYDRSGDEPYLIATKVPKALVLVGKDRIQAGFAAIKLGAQVLILDDGFQHLRLNRDENLLLLDGYTHFNSGHLLPKGNLRELPDAIRRATAIIISNSNKTSISDVSKIKQLAPNLPIVSFRYKIKGFTGINVKRTMSLEQAKGLKVIAFAGIANHESFIDSLKQLGLNTIDLITFADHHNYSFDDIKQIIQSAKGNAVENIITTEKDALKLENLCEAAPATFWSSNLEIVWDLSNPFDTILVNKEKWHRSHKR